MRLVGSHSTSGREKEGNKERMGVLLVSILKTQLLNTIMQLLTDEKFHIIDNKTFYLLFSDVFLEQSGRTIII
jgi:hypothetical protein